MTEPGPGGDRLLSVGLAGVGAVAVGAAIQVFNGYGRPPAFAWLTLAVAAVFLAVVLPTHRAVEGALARALPALLWVGLVGQLHALIRTTPARPFAAVTAWPSVFLLAATAAATAALVVVVAGGAVRLLAAAALVGVHLALGVWTIRLQPAPSPMIDVFLFQQYSATALAAGGNPYALTFPNPYPTLPYYGPGMVVDGRLTFGFPYPPLSVYLSAVGQWLGDVRYAQLAAMTLAAVLMATARPGALGPLAAGLYLFTPRNLFVLEQSWTEPFVVLFLAVTVWCACRWPRATPVALGLFVAVKQYAVLALPLALLLGWPPSWRRTARLVVPAGLVAAAVTLPLALGEPAGFVRSVVTLQFAQPFRPEALSYLGRWAGPYVEGTPAPPPPFGPGVAFAVAGLVGALALWRLPRTPSGFALATSALFLAFFALNKQAFANYYFFVIGALCVAVAAAASPPTRPDRAWETGRRARGRGARDRVATAPDPAP